MDTAGENPRGEHAIRLLEVSRAFTVGRLMAAAYDPLLPAFEVLIPGLVAAWDRTRADDPLKIKLRDPIALLRAWNHRWSADSAATSLAVFWGERLWAEVKPGPDAPQLAVIIAMAYATSDRQKLAALAAASDQLQTDFGNWRTPWGEINRFQRLDDAIAPQFSDAAPSIPVPFTASKWGSLAAFSARAHDGTKRWYGTRGNSFVAVVEFGPRVRAVAVTAGGESGDPGSPHFNDEAGRYAQGQLREVYFWPDQLKGHIERVYHPGE
jgi:acyl-homoserine-lactone acylase